MASALCIDAARNQPYNACPLVCVLSAAYPEQASYGSSYSVDQERISRRNNVVPHYGSFVWKTTETNLESVFCTINLGYIHEYGGSSLMFQYDVLSAHVGQSQLV